MDRSDFLFASPSFMTGIARSLDLGATLSGHSYNLSVGPIEADLRALLSDWNLVGHDLQSAIDAYTEEENPDKAAA
jgi:hypothetical protein